MKIPKKQILLLYTLIFMFSMNVFAQQQLKIGTDIPLQYGFGYKYSPENGIGGGLKLGVLTEPHNSIILSIMESLGTKESVVEIVRDGFKAGLILDGSASWHRGKNYVGANVIFLNLSAGDAPIDIIDNYYGLDLAGFWDPLSSIFGLNQMLINLNSNLIQFGVHYGRRIPLKDKLELQIEIGFSKNIGSTNNFSSDFPYPQSTFDLIDEDLSAVYKKYVIIPTLGIYLVYNL